MTPKALIFDVFGTVVDWRGSIIREGRALAAEQGLGDVDWARFADAWRALYQPSMEEVRSGKRKWTLLDTLHRESLEVCLAEFDIHGLFAEDIDHLNRAWHRLEPWPDSVPGLNRLKTKFPIATCSNGNVALMVNMARRAGLPWDAILGAEPMRAYKPMEQAYVSSAAMLGCAPEEAMMVACHNDDLAAARSFGLQCAFIKRPDEWGPGANRDVVPAQDWEFVAEDFEDLASQLET